MSDEEATLDTGNSATQENYEQRFKDTQGAFTKSQQELAAERGVWDDEQAALARLAEKFPHLFESEDEEIEDDDEIDVEDPTATELADVKKQVAEQQAWRAQVEQERGEARFTSDLTSELGDREVTARQRDWIKDRTAALGNNPKALKQAVEEFTGIVEELTAKPAARKRAPAVIANGQTVTATKPWSEMSDSEALAAQVERAQALSTQT